MAGAQYPAVTAGGRDVAHSLTATTDVPVFVGPGERADVAVLVVTYNNAADVDRLVASLRAEAVGHRLRVVVADNASSDGTPARLARHPDLTAFGTGGNLGYAAGINQARRRAGEADALLVLNPDLTVLPGAISALLARLRHPGVGAVVPRVVDADGATYPSLRREPTPARALGEALLGPRWPGRPAWLAEVDHDPAGYLRAHPVDWATGAAVLVDRTVAEEVGDWDERFFLYSEETDFFLRVRQAGHEVWYEPTATVRHVQGGSGTSPALVALMDVNRVRYAAKHRSRAHARLLRFAVTLGEAARLTDPSHRSALRFLLDSGSWDRLPHAQPLPVPPDPATFPSGSVVIPAHDEEAVLARTLRPLAPLAAAGRVEVVVACNGCTDRTAEVAAGFDAVTVLEVPEASKVAALNAADRVAERWPRLYLDADIELPPAALRDLFLLLGTGSVPAARPPFVYDDRGASAVVRSYYRARRRLPGTNRSLWGAGAYALSEKGRDRFGEFPALTADDLFVDTLFDEDEVRVVDTLPVVVRTPRDLPGLLAVLRRTYRGNAELLRAVGEPAATGRAPRRRAPGGMVGQLARSVTGPRSAVDAVVYATLAVAARLLRRRTTAVGWERDVSSRR